MPPGANPFDTLGPAMANLGWAMLLSTAVSVTYSTWFIGALGATPGMMVCGLKVVRPDGSPIGYGRAFARYFAAMLSSYDSLHRLSVDRVRFRKDARCTI